jgi:hypothetical protein
MSYHCMYQNVFMTPAKCFKPIKLQYLSIYHRMIIAVCGDFYVPSHYCNAYICILLMQHMRDDTEYIFVFHLCNLLYREDGKQRCLFGVYLGT